MAAITSNLFLYSLSLQPPSSVTQAVVGTFGGGGAKDQYILTGTGSSLNLLRPDANDGEVTTILSHNVFGIIRSLAAFRLAGTGKDYILVGTDSGRITTLEYLPDENRFQRVHLETFGKSGVRRAIPGQYLAVDPKGRACMIASIEKNKLVFVLNRDPQANLTISSPLEAHTPATIVYAVISLDVSYENPIFAALEVDYSESDLDPDGIAYEQIEKQLVYYELDLGLNHVVRKWAEPVDRSANLLFQVPGGADGPSGVLVCAEETITYRHINQDAHRLIIPRRKGAAEDPDRKRHIVAGVMHKMKGAFFILVQTEDGDLFKVTMTIDTDRNSDDFGRVLQLKLQYFATLPVATSLLILKSGTLFVASECGEHRLYRFLNLGDDYPGIDSMSYSAADNSPPPYDPEYFHAQEMEDSLEPLTTIDTSNPLLASKVANITDDDAPQIFSVCGTGARSSFKMMRHGLNVSELAESPLPAAPNAIWTTKLAHEDMHDSYIILAFNNYTLVLSVGESIEEVSSSETGFLPNVPTLAVQLLADNALVQIHHRGLRHIRPGGSSNDWEAPQHRTIVAAATNERQVALALSSGQVIYFEIDESGSLGEYEDQPEMQGTVKCLSLGTVPEGRQRSPFLAVGCDDLTVRILSTDPNNILTTLAVQALTYSPSALQIMEMADPTSGGSTLYLHVGLQSGVYIRVVLDEVTGNLSDSTTRFLGPKPVKFTQADVQGHPALMALSSRSWLVYSDLRTNVLKVTPLSYERLDHAWRLSSSLLSEGIVAVAGQTLRIFSIPSIKSNLLTTSIPLAYTPRDLAKHPEYPYFVAIESDANVLPSATRIRMQSDPAIVNGDATVLPPAEFGYPRGTGHWASCIQVVDPLNSRIAHTLDLEDNEAATSCVVAPIESQDNESFLFVGTGKDMVSMPRSASCGYIHVYRIDVAGTGAGDKMQTNEEAHVASQTVTLEFLHKTKVQHPPMALHPFQGRLLAGIGPHLTIFDVGIQQLLRKALKLDLVPNVITSLQTQGSRILVGDARESFMFVKYDYRETVFLPFADDTIARWTTCQAQVDYDTVAGADKFGNIFLLRCPPDASNESDGEGAAQLLRHEKGYLAGAPNKLHLVAHFFTADIPMSLHKTTMVAGGRDVLLWTGLQGTMAVLVPFVSRDDVEFFSDLERQMRETEPPLCGRDHLIYRGYYQPVKGVIDGDLCERFLALSMDDKMRVAAALEKSVREVVRKVGDMRIRSAF